MISIFVMKIITFLFIYKYIFNRNKYGTFPHFSLFSLSHTD